MTGSLWGFLLISAAVIMTPGPDTIVTVRSTLMRGRAAGLATALGIACGQMIWAAATSIGLVAILLASEPVFNAIKLAGAAYLMWLGVQTLRAALTARDSGGSAAMTGSGRRMSVRAAFRDGLISDLGNPKMAVFFASVLPQFAAPGQGMLSSLMLLGLLFSTLALAWLALYAVVVAAAGAAYRGSRIGRTIEGLMGAALIGLGLRLATEPR
jgi:RhtB (resistance to homoserine/threonine) family protein